MNNDNTRVLACRIDEKLQQDMKKYLAEQKKTVKDYIIGLIESDLAKNEVKESSNVIEIEKAIVEVKQEDSKITNDEKASDENLKAEPNKNETSKGQKLEKSKKENSKTIPLAECKEKIKNQVTKKNSKEEEEEFE